MDKTKRRRMRWKSIRKRRKKQKTQKTPACVQCEQRAVLIWKKKKTLRETQTLRAGCSKAEPKILIPPQTLFPGVRDGQNLISWRWSPSLPTDPVWWGSMLAILMHAISSYRGNRPTNTPTDRTDYNTLRRSLVHSVK